MAGLSLAQKQRLPACDPSGALIAGERESPEFEIGRNSNATSPTTFHTEYGGCVFHSALCSDVVHPTQVGGDLFVG